MYTEKATSYWSISRLSRAFFRERLQYKTASSKILMEVKQRRVPVFSPIITMEKVEAVGELSPIFSQQTLRAIRKYSLDK
jgi:hypothetical protein